MPTNFDSGFGTGNRDELYETREQAGNAFADFMKRLLGRGESFYVKSRTPDGRTVTHASLGPEGHGRVRVSVRVDLQDPHLPGGGSLDVVSSVLGPGGKKRIKMHFGFKRSGKKNKK